jgi:hypothetical protein
MIAVSQSPGIRTVAALAMLAVLAGCASSSTLVDVPADGHSRTIHADAGQEIAVTLGNVGPGTYGSPPVISSPVLSFVDVAVVPPYSPAGPTQRFRFRAVSSGRAVVRFQRVLDTSVLMVVEDTIQIR